MTGARNGRSAYERLLVLYPKRFRDRYGREMADLFEDVRSEATGRGGGLRVLLVWGKALADLAVGAAAERGRSLMGVPVVRLCGLLAALGGILVSVAGLCLPWLYLHSGDLGGSVLDRAVMPAGSLLSLCGVVGLVALIASEGAPSGPGIGTMVRVRRLGLAQAVALGGLSCAAVAVLAELALVAVMVLFGGIAVGPTHVPSDSPLLAIFGAAAIASRYAAPVAVLLLGLAARGAGVLRRGGRAAMGAGLVILLAPFLGILGHAALWWLVYGGYALQSELPPGLSVLVEATVPTVATGAGWAVLGYVLLRHPGDRRSTGLAASV